MERKNITINNQTIEYKLHRRRGNKSLRLAVKATGEIVVSAPRYFPLYLIKQFVISRREWLNKHLQVAKEDRSLFSRKFTTAEINDLKKQTLNLVKDRLGYYNQFYNFKFNRIAIRNQSTRWGSCSRNKNLNFNCRLCLLPQELADYVIVHELCHLEEMNHGPKFWQLVNKIMPDYKNLRAKLRKI